MSGAMGVGGDGGRRVAVLEDDAELRGMICDSLAADGFSPVAYASGEAFLAQLPGAAAGLDALIADVKLGGMDGFETVRAARQARPDLPVVFVSGDLRPLMRATDPRQMSLMKPFTREALRNVLGALLD